jgi:hypothetical protein
MRLHKALESKERCGYADSEPTGKKRAKKDNEEDKISGPYLLPAASRRLYEGVYYYA